MNKSKYWFCLFLFVLTSASIVIFQTSASAASFNTLKPTSKHSRDTGSVRSIAGNSLNPIQQENQLPGTTNWYITNPSPFDASNYTSDQGIEGYAFATSAAAGDTLRFAVNTPAASFTADIYRLGWYQSLGANLKTSIANVAGHAFAIPPVDPQTGLLQATWPAAFSVTIPTTWVSGMYLVKLTASNGYQSYIPFVVKTSASSDFVVVHTVDTDEAYNDWGGDSLYIDHTGQLAHRRAFKVSFDRPFLANFGAGYMLSWEYQAVRWLEANGYNLSYISDVDLDRSMQVVLHHKGALIIGHSEYWSKGMRNHLEGAVARGVNLGAFGANDIYWQVRFEKSSSNVPNRVITCYKDAALDPLNGKDNSDVTVQFRQAPVNRPEQTLLGSMFNSYFPESQPNYPWRPNLQNVPGWIFSGTQLKQGDQLAGLVGYEFDSVMPNYPGPKTKGGGIDIVAVSPVVDIWGNQSNANSTLYIALSGARVFNAGTIVWSWGLDNWTLLSQPPNVANAATQQITANILANFLTS